MIDSYEVSHTAKEDLAVIYELFDHSIKYQEKRGFPVWKNYDRSAIVRDIEEKNQYKVVVEGQILAIVFSVCCLCRGYVERAWRKGDAIYLHRIVVNPAFKGQQLFGAILQWAIQHGNEKGLKFVRMDTWAANPNIVEYYKRFDFKFIESFTGPDTMEGRQRRGIPQGPVEGFFAGRFQVDRRPDPGNPPALPGEVSAEDDGVAHLAPGAAARHREVR